MRVGVIFVFINPLTLQLELVELLGSDRNTGEKDQQVDMKALIPQSSSVSNPSLTVRDLWRQKDLAPSELTCAIPLHGCRYLKVWLK